MMASVNAEKLRMAAAVLLGLMIIFLCQWHTLTLD